MRLFYAALLLAGCSAATVGTSSDDSSGTAELGENGRPQFPSFTDHGGGVIAAPDVQPVVWQGDEAIGAQLTAFDTWMLAKPDYWGTLAQYGVNAGTAHPPIVLPGPAPATLDDADVPALIESLISNGTITTPTANTVLSFVPPSSTKVTLGCDVGCVNFGGYHHSTPEKYVYTMNLQCPTGGQDAFTKSVSHELSEAVTDPYAVNAAATSSWVADVTQGEVGDLCSISGGVSLPAGDGSGKSYRVERLFSLAAVTAGKGDPCLPLLSSQPYFNVAIEPLHITVQLDANGNGKGSFELVPFADARIGSIDWQLQTTRDGTRSPVTFDQGFDGPSYPSFGNADPGDSQKITFEVRGAKQSQYSIFAIGSVNGNGIVQAWTADLVLVGGPTMSSSCSP